VEEPRTAVPPPTQSPPLTDTFEALVTKLGSALRKEIRRTLLGFVIGLASIVLLFVASVGCVVAGMIRLGDALGRVCGVWLGDPSLGDVMAGLFLLTVPLTGFLVLRLRRW
jgi:hypothetical protein